ncbi:dTDP-4-dehydrorhamnose reductase [Acerihabitans sp. TG2]|uniref:dTDP-4-dehydrorhamnose reductase n=1 Tax=Acerihabitans sp. TG2 TaxID=3096008 RepID=UPI002B23E3F7|nr:dTDP-4-dehydrorhamnose reductase [Acerihabitans sp. TG2]MEA9389295.1 dTDP-4-dehydrorhamnose reductase [Acerihabitans sp. TG2]
MKILLAGANGQLGRCFQDRAPKDWQIMATDSDSLDITDAVQVEKTVAQFHPDLIVNAAAYTAVDKAESDVELAQRINAKGPENLAIAAKSINAGFVHISTDYVFDGTSTTPYKETDPTNPLSVYGATKLEGELAVQQAYPQTLIIRTAWVFSEYGNNFVKTILRLSREKESLSIVDDQRGCPTYAGDIAQAIIQLYQSNALAGIYHFCGDREVSWKEFTDQIVDTADTLKLISRRPVIKGIGTSEYPTAAHRPTYSTLSCKKIEIYGIRPSNWMSALNYCISRIF